MNYILAIQLHFLQILLGNNQFFGIQIIRTHDESAEALESKIIKTFYECVKAWSYGCDNICIELSGGLDSSSLLIMLKEAASAEIKLTCVNLFHPAVLSSDEREYAKKVADLCNVELRYIDWSNCESLSTLLTRRINKPTSFSLDEGISQQLAEITANFNNLELMSGQGGDHLFMSSPSIESIADYICAHGLKDLWPKAQEISAYYRTPLLKIILQNIKSLINYKLGRINNNFNFAIQPWMKNEFNKKIDYNLNKVPFWKTLKNTPPAKLDHMTGIYSAILFTDIGYRNEGKPVINPFLSQPMVELALSIPSYKLYKNGYNRYPFRNSMNKFKKNEAVWRKGKGETSGALTTAFNANNKIICELALDGKFAKNGLVDRDLLFKQIIEVQHGKAINSWPLTNLLAAELWFKIWNL